MAPAPVLCIAFNRPDLFQRVLDACGLAGPRELFVSIDGARPGHPTDPQLREQVREIASHVAWATAIHTKISEQNLGCGLATSSAVSWALERHDRVIVFDDDCLPDPSFLALCDELLERYRDDERVMHIAATNWGASSERFGSYSYAFTAFAPVWGWATWRRAWSLNDYDLDSWTRVKSSGLLRGMSIEPRMRRLLERDWQAAQLDGGEWDQKWQYSLLRQHGLSICPARNLVVNIGFRPDGWQLKEPDLLFGGLPLEAVGFPLRHPPEVVRNPSVDSVFTRIYWQKRGWPGRAFRWLVRNPGLNRIVRTVVRRWLLRPT